MKSAKSRSLVLAVPEELAGSRLDKAIAVLAAREEPGLSRARVQALMAEGNLRFSGKEAMDGSRKAKAGESYELILPPPEKAEPKAQKIPLTVVYEDKDVIVIDKPAGLVVHPAPGNRDRTLVNALLAHCGESLSGIGGVARPGIVHRLDKDTSGLIVAAKNDAAHAALSGQFADRSLSRTYWALVWGTPVPPVGKIDAPVGRSARDRKKMAVTGKGRSAVTHYKVIEDFGGVSLVECRLETGRTHQIRVHMAHIKHPVVGDKAYGKGRVSKGPKALQDFPRQALHAVEIHFAHPRTGKVKKFASKPPLDIQKLLRALRASKK